jgi:hypothetical protein
MSVELEHAAPHCINLNRKAGSGCVNSYMFSLVIALTSSLLLPPKSTAYSLTAIEIVSESSAILNSLRVACSFEISIAFSIV